MGSTPFSLSCVVPAYNEAGHLAAFLVALRDVVANITPHYEILVINDGSRDNTREITLNAAADCGVRYLELSRNFGKEAALSAGLDHARGDVVLLIDSDFQHPLEMVPEMIGLWQNGYDMVYGVLADRSQDSVLKRVGTNAFYRLMTFGSKITIPRDAGDFRLMDRKVVDALRALPERNRFMKGLYAWVGFRSVAIPFVAADRAGGKSSFSLRRLGGLALSGLTAFTVLPLRIWSLIGFTISIVALLYGIYTVIMTLIFGNQVPGWTTLVVGLMFFSGVQLLSIGILGEYLGRVYDEVKNRPIYVVAHDADHSRLTRAEDV
ncbi:MAG: glycosyltransferase family 2 protein [Stenotrophobium sp.]